jgi:hypothetical protein
VGLRDQERDEERADGQRGHHEYSQHDVAIWKTPAYRLEEASRNRLPFLFRKHCYPPILRDRQYRDSMNLSTIRHVIAALVNVGYRLPWQVEGRPESPMDGKAKKVLVQGESRLAACMAKADVLQQVLTCPISRMYWCARQNRAHRCRFAIGNGRRTPVSRSHRPPHRAMPRYTPKRV